MIQLAQHFRSDLSDRHSEWLRQRQWFIKAKVDQEKRDDAAEKSEADLAALAAEVMIATDIQLREFQTRLKAFEVKLDHHDAKLDIYDEAVTRALIEQIEKMDILKAAHSEILAEAHILEDGRRVFKSEDGTFVIDENGEDISSDVILPEMISDKHPTAETFLASLSAMESVQSEIDALHTAQSEIDAAREQNAKTRLVIERGSELVEKEGVTVGELDELESELDAAIPKSLPKLPVTAAKFLSGADHATAPAVGYTFASASSTFPLATAINPEKAPNGFEVG